MALGTGSSSTTGSGGAGGPQCAAAAPPKETIILKLGGSSITDKGGYEALKPEGLAAAAALIQRCHEQGLGVIVVHGAGSFGHPQAKKYQINKGWASQALEGATKEERRAAFEKVRFGFAATRCSVLKLSNLILSELVGRGLPATSLSACGAWHTEGGKVTKSTTGVVAALLGLGFIPVLHGDGVLDDVKGCNVLSGDTIIRELARDVPSVKRVVFLTDVDGVFDKSPELPGASLISQILVDEATGNIASLVTTESSGGKDDVTGGMELKLSTAIAIQVDHAGAVPVFISKVGSEASADACLKGDVGARATKLCCKA